MYELHSISSYENSQIVFTPEQIALFKQKISEAEENIKENCLDINYYETLEKSLIKSLSEYNYSKDNLKLMKASLLMIIKEKFLSEETEKRKNIIFEIQSTFYKFLEGINNIGDLRNIITIEDIYYDKGDPDSNNNENLIRTLKSIQDAIWGRCFNLITDEIDIFETIQSLPTFLIKNERKILKNRIEKILTDEFDVPFNYIKFSLKPSFIHLKHFFDLFFDNKKNIFDEKEFSKEERIWLFKLFIHSNLSYIKYENNRRVFMNNLKKYIFGFRLNDDYQALLDLFDEVIHGNTLIDKDEMMNELSEIINVEEQEKNMKFLFFIFSMSCLLNNLACFTEVDGEVQTSFTPQLLISSRERQFLLNTFNFIDNFFKRNLSANLNIIVENYVMGSLIKSYTKVLFDENNKKKISLDSDTIKELIRKNIDEPEDELVFSNLSPDQAEILKESYTNFLNTNQNFINDFADSEEGEGLMGFLSSNLKKIKPKIFSDDQENCLSLKDLQIIPSDPFSISPHICICIYGKFYPVKEKVKLKNIWNTILNDKKVDFYFFDWQNEDNFFQTSDFQKMTGYVKGYFNSFISNKKIDLGQVEKETVGKEIQKNIEISEFYGKLLAYILVSRCIFKFHSISLLGYSIGCNVIKYCLKEMESLQEKGMRISEIIQNIIFVGGATTIGKEDEHLFGSLAGRVINCYSKKDESLWKYFSTECVGAKELKIKESDKDYEPRVENIDLSNFLLTQEEYQTEMPNIISQIKNL